jgi:hypothetical protein
MDTAIDDATKSAGTPESGRITKLAPIAISLVALVISSLTFFLTQLQPARIRVHPAEFAYVTSKTDNLEFHLPLTFVNDGAALGIVQKVALLIQSPGRSDGYLLQAAYFEKLESGDYKPESVVVPIPIEGRRTLGKQVLFISARDTPRDNPLSVTGPHRATVLVWASEAIHPTATAPFQFVLSDRDLADLEAQRLGKRTETIELHQEKFRSWNARPVNEQDVRELLSGAPA